MHLQPVGLREVQWVLVWHYSGCRGGIWRMQLRLAGGYHRYIHGTTRGQLGLPFPNVGLRASGEQAPMRMLVGRMVFRPVGPTNLCVLALLRLLKLVLFPSVNGGCVNGAMR